MGDFLNENYGKNKLVRLEEEDLIRKIGDMVVEEDVCTGDVRMRFDLHGLALRGFAAQSAGSCEAAT